MAHTLSYTTSPGYILTSEKYCNQVSLSSGIDMVSGFYTLKRYDFCYKLTYGALSFDIYHYVQVEESQCLLIQKELDVIFDKERRKAPDFKRAKTSFFTDLLETFDCLYFKYEHNDPVALHAFLSTFQFRRVIIYRIPLTYLCCFLDAIKNGLRVYDLLLWTVFNGIGRLLSTPTCVTILRIKGENTLPASFFRTCFFLSSGIKFLTCEETSGNHWNPFDGYKEMFSGLIYMAVDFNCPKFDFSIIGNKSISRFAAFSDDSKEKDSRLRILQEETRHAMRTFEIARNVMIGYCEFEDGLLPSWILKASACKKLSICCTNLIC